MEVKFDEIIDRYNTNCAKWDEAAEEYGHDLIYLGVADMDFKSPEPVIESMKKVIEHGIFGYTVLNSNYFKTVQNWIKTRFDWEVEKDWIVFSPRISVAVSLIIQTLTKEGDGVIIQSPGYAPLREAIVKNNRKLILNPLKLENGQYKMNLKNLEDKMDSSVKIFILCSPHNPVGRVWTREELEELAEFCIKHDLIIISDEIHSDILYKGCKHTPLGLISKEIQDRCIVCNSITKTFNVPGVITSNVIIPNERIRNVIKNTIDKCGIHNPNIFSVPAVEAAYTKCDEWLVALLEYMEGNYKYFEKYINNKMPKFKIIKPEGTYLVWVDCRELGLSEEELENFFIKKAKVGIYLGSIFGEEGKGFIRVNLGTSRKNIEMALERINKVYSEIIR